MRITQGTLYNNTRQQIQNRTQSLLIAQEQVATEKRINRLSDDPIGSSRLLSLNTSISKTTQYLSNISRADSTADIVDSTLDNVDDVLSRVKELLVQETNESSSTATTREAARSEISMLTSQLVNLANTKYDGSYIFSGFQTETAPFNDTTMSVTAGTVTGGETVTASSITDRSQTTNHNYQIQFTAAGQFDVVDTTSGTTVLSNQTYASGSAVEFDGLSITLSNSPGAPAAGDTFNVTLTAPGQYSGDSQIQYVEIQDGTQVAANMTGDTIFKGAGLTGGVDVFSIMNQINAALRSNDQTSMDALLNQVDAAQSQISNQRSINGARTNLMDSVKEHQTTIQTSLKTLASSLEDVDITDAALELTKQQDMYTASLSVASKVLTTSLIDFLN